MKRWPQALVLLWLPLAAGGAEPPEAGASRIADSAMTKAATTDGLLTRGREMMLRQQWPQAVDLFTEALKIDPESDVAQFGLGTAYIKVGRYSEARDVFERLRKQYPRTPAVLNNLAWILVRASDPNVRDPQRAIRLAQDGLLLAPEDLNVWGTLAEAYYAVGQYSRALRIATATLERALDAVEDAVVSGPNYDNPWVRVARVQHAVGNRAEARKAARMAFLQLPEAYGESPLKDFEVLQQRCRVAADGVEPEASGE